MIVEEVTKIFSNEVFSIGVCVYLLWERQSLTKKIFNYLKLAPAILEAPAK